MHPFDSQQFIGENSTGPLTTNTAPNYAFSPHKYASSFGKIAGIGNAGTRSNVQAAKGKYVPYVGGSRLSHPQIEHPSKLIGPNTGHPIHSSYVPSGQPRDLHRSFAGGRKSKKHRYNRHKYSRTTHSKSRRSKSTKLSSNKNKKMNKRMNKYKSRKLRGGGSGIPFSNVPMSWGYSLGQQLPNSLNALANPPPMTAYNNCSTIKRG